MSTAIQIRAIHALARDAGLDKAMYRAALAGHSGKASSKDLSEAEARDFIAALKGLSKAVRTPRATATGPYAAKLQALWISGWNLGVVRARDDPAMLAFVARQTGLAHTRFLVEAAAGAKAVEGLKAWLAREGGVVWPDRDGDAKRAVHEAIARKLIAAGGFKPFAHPGYHASDFEAYGHKRGIAVTGFADYLPGDWDRLNNWLGARLRATLADKARGSAAP